MEIHLNPELENYVSSKLKYGYSTPSEFVADSLYKLKKQDAIQYQMLKDEVQKGIDSLEEFGGQDGEEVMARLLGRINNRNA